MSHASSDNTASSAKSVILQVAATPATSEAESTINAILELLERSNNKQIATNGSFDSSLSIDANAQLVREVDAIVKDYQAGKDAVPHSGVDGLDIVLPGPHNDGRGVAQRVSDTETDPLNVQLRNRPQNLVRIDDHVDIEDFVRDMMDAGRRSRVRKPKYSNVQVLTITWKEDPKSDDSIKSLNQLIEDEVDTVNQLFQETLHYSVQRYLIPQVNSQAKLQLEVSKFVDKHDEPDALLIIYYNGHGSYWEDSCFWHPTEEAGQLHSGFNPHDPFRGPSVKWNPIQDSVITEADVLVVLDCCYAGASLIEGTKGPCTTKEILTACGRAQKTLAGKNSFSMRFVTAINESLVSKSRFPVTELYTRMLAKAKQKPEPLHAFICGSGSIIIERQPDPDPKPESTSLDLQIPGLNPRGISPASSISGLDNNDTFSQSLSPPGVARTEASSTSSTASSRLVTLAIRLKEDVIPKFDNWKEFVNLLPPEETAGFESVKVTVEAVFPSNSTMLIVSMPTSYWLLLPKSPAYTFLGFVKGSNQLLSDKPKAEAGRIMPVARIDSDKSTFDNHEMIPHLLTAIQEFLEKTKSQDLLKHRQPGVFAQTCQQLATKFGVPSRLETDPRFGIVRHLVQQIVVERNDQGEYTGLSYDLHFIEKLFERGKKSVKEALHAAQPKNEKLETTITTKIDQIEQQVLNTLGAETLGSKLSFEKVHVGGEVKPVRSHTRSRHSLGRTGGVKV